MKEVNLYTYETKRITNFWLSLAVLQDADKEYCLQEDPDGVEFDLANAFFCFCQDYNDNNPLINQINQILSDTEYRPALDMSTDSLEGDSLYIYDELERGHDFYLEKANEIQFGLTKA